MKENRHEWKKLNPDEWQKVTKKLIELQRTIARAMHKASLTRVKPSVEQSKQWFNSKSRV